MKEAQQMNITRPGFDYGQLDGGTWKFVQDARDEIRRLGRSTARNIIEIGGHLVAVKERLPWGQWGAWLAAELPWITERTANNWMNAHIWVANSESVSELSDAQLDQLLNSLSPTGLYLLASPDTPESATQEVIERALQGEVLPPTEVKKTVAEHKPPRQRETTPRFVRLQRIYRAMEPRERNRVARWILEQELKHTSLETKKGAALERMLKALTFDRPDDAQLH
jgi:Protein of unknown function (DUF3102)